MIKAEGISQLAMKNNKDVVSVFRDGGVVIFPTDTAIGIGCRIDNVEAVERIYEIRHRPPEKPLLILVSSFEMVQEYAIPLSEKEYLLMKKYWPGGITFVINANEEKVPAIVRANGPTIAVRLPDNNELIKIIDEIGVPIVAPSANFSGGKTPLKIEEVDDNLKKQVDFVLPGVCKMEGISTILDLTQNPYQILRQGVVDVPDEDLIP